MKLNAKELREFACKLATIWNDNFIMARAIVLDSFPLSCMGKRRSSPASLADQCQQGVIDCIVAGHLIYAPAIAYYETLRELERLKASSQIARLRQFCFVEPERFIVLQTAQLEAAAQLWAQARQTGQPTADAQALDGDVILAAQARSLGLSDTEYVIATTNTAHLSRFVPAADWTQIVPGS